MNKFENLRVFWGDSDLNYLTISAKFGYLVDCYFDDPDGKTFQKACEFLGASKGLPTAFAVITRATREIVDRESQRNTRTAMVNSGALRHA